MLLLGYNTNGFGYHRLEDCFAILHELGYRSVAVTVERDLLDPPDWRGVDAAAERLHRMAAAHPMRLTIETGARFILDPWCKHQPTLVSADPERRRKRIDFLKACIELAGRVAADSVSLWSGAADQPDESPVLIDRLTDALRDLLDFAEARRVRLAFEPEPGMVIDTMSGFEQLGARLDHPNFGLTLDVGHIHCLDDGTPAEHIRRWAGQLWNIHIEDMRRGIHEHLMFGEGDMDFSSVFQALRNIGYSGPVHVELARHSHEAVEAARKSIDFLTRF